MIVLIALFAADAASGVLCPVCKSCQLVQRQGLLVCPSEGWRLNLSREGVNMDTIKANLAAAYEVRRLAHPLCG